MALKDLLRKAVKLATAAHKEQTRWNGDPYITHPLRVKESVKVYTTDPDLTLTLQIIAVLHDIVEDTDISLVDLKEEGFPEVIVRSISHLTKKRKETYAEYLERVSQDNLATVVKLLDLQDNLSDLDGNKNRQRRDKYQLAVKYLELAQKYHTALPF